LNGCLCGYLIQDTREISPIRRIKKSVDVNFY
jgi:hypothetical protein